MNADVTAPPEGHRLAVATGGGWSWLECECGDGESSREDLTLGEPRTTEDAIALWRMHLQTLTVHDVHWSGDQAFDCSCGKTFWESNSTKQCLWAAYMHLREEGGGTIKVR